MEELIKPLITSTPDVLIYCANCYDTESPEYRLRRKSGKYLLLCFKNGEGCWERSPKPICSFKDNYGIQCTNQAEWEIAYGDNQTKTQRCVIHVGQALSDVDEHRIYAV
jgi:hypothetical protein